MLGVILCGGQSTRMGTDKGMLKMHPDAGTWAKAAADKMAQLTLPVIVSVNTLQYNDYATVFDAAQLITDNPLLDIRGPLGGVLSVHEKYPMQDLFVLACDMPLMDADVLKQLLDIYHLDTNDDAFVFTNNGEPEPLCAIYTARGLAHIRQLYQSNQLLKHSMKFMLEHINSWFEPLSEEQKKCFQNFNAHAALNGL